MMTAPWAMPPLAKPEGRLPDERTGDPQYFHLILLPGQRTWFRANWAQVLSAKAIGPSVAIKLEQPVQLDPSWELKGRPTIELIEHTLGKAKTLTTLYRALVSDVDQLHIVDPKGAR